MNDKKPCFIGIDTSNYTTSFAACDEDGNVFANIKRLLPVKDGERGLRQSDAVFAHLKNFSLIADAIREAVRDFSPLAVGVSDKPRNAEGSYMPCFLSGVAVAETLASALGVPLFRFAHQDGHIMAACYSSSKKDELLSAPFAAFHLSGGTTEALYVTPGERAFTVEKIGGTADINAGQAIDRVGVRMGFSFPAGKEMERAAMTYEGKLPPRRICVRDGICHLSGLENIAGKLYDETSDPAFVSAYVFTFIGETVAAMSADVRARYGDLPILYAGGVMSNRRLQTMLAAGGKTFFAEPAFSADNAAGIALLAKENYQK